MKTIYISYSKKGIPCVWEQGGGFTNTGSAVIVADSVGRPKRPLYIRRRGSLACDYHALIPITTGDVVVTADHHRKDFTIEVVRIIEIPSKKDETDKGEANAEIISRYDAGEWVPELPIEFFDAVQAAKNKAVCYHCREPHFIEKNAL